MKSTIYMFMIYNGDSDVELLSSDMNKDVNNSLLESNTIFECMQSFVVVFKDIMHMVYFI